MQKRRWVVGIVMILAWLLIGFTFSVNDYVYKDLLKDYYRSLESFGDLISWDLIYWPTWALFALLIYWIARRFPLGRNSWRPNFLINLLAALLLIILQRAVYLLILMGMSLQKLNNEQFIKLLFYNLPTGLMSYCFILLFMNYARNEEKLIRASRLEVELTQKELQMSRLKAESAQAQLLARNMQLEPHFLFNALNSIAALLHEDVNAADEMLARLGDFLRLTLGHFGAQTVTLKEELEFLRRYLEIEKIRLEDRLRVHYEIEPQALAAQVPTLILQPSIENAIKHGVQQSLGQVQIVVSVRREGETLYLQIKDDGEQWQSSSSARKEGVGITNTRDRLESVYGAAQRFDLTRTSDGWTVATIEMPFVSSAENIEAPASP